MMNEKGKETYMLKRRNDQTRRIEHLMTLSSPPDLEKVKKEFGEGKYLVFVVQRGKKGIRKYMGFSVDKNGKIAEGTPLAKKAKKKDTTQGVDIPKRSLEIAGGKHVRRDYYKTVPVVPVTMMGMSSEVKKEKTIEDKKTDKELEECVVSKDSFIDDMLTFMAMLIVSGGTFLGLSVWKNKAQK